MRDATRGGAAAVLNEAVHGTALGMEVEEADFPISDDVRTVSDLLGLNPMEIANEGVFVAVVAGSAEREALDALRAHPLGSRRALRRPCFDEKARHGDHENTRGRQEGNGLPAGTSASADLLSAIRRTPPSTG